MGGKKHWKNMDNRERRREICTKPKHWANRMMELGQHIKTAIDVHFFEIARQHLEELDELTKMFSDWLIWRDITGREEE